MIKIKNLDIVITRSCQLNCKGCLVFSDHNLVKGHIDVDTSIEWLDFWANHLSPSVVHLFGGEPLMHPDFVKWAETVRKIFGKSVSLNVQTNGIKIKDFDPQTLKYLVNNLGLHFNITVHSDLEWYRLALNKGIELLIECLPNGKWTSVNESQKIYVQNNGICFEITESTKRPWVNHYTGHGYNLKPSFEFTSDKYVSNHSYCEAKEYVQLYNGNLYKCPVMATLDDTLSKYNYPNKEQWEPWLNYKSLPYGSSVDEITAWVSTQSQPERYCNICFGEELPVTVHTLKIK